MGKLSKQKKRLSKTSQFCKLKRRECINGLKNQFNQQDLSSDFDSQQTISSDFASEQNNASSSNSQKDYASGSNSQETNASSSSSHAANIPHSSPLDNYVSFLDKYLGKEYFSRNSQSNDLNFYDDKSSSDEMSSTSTDDIDDDKIPYINSLHRKFSSDEMSSTSIDDMDHDKDEKLENNLYSSEMENPSKPLIFAIKEQRWIFILTHPAKVQVNSQANIRVLSGGISIFGHEISHKSSPFDVFSFKNIMYFQIITRYAGNITQNSSHSKKLKVELTNLDEDLASFILNYCKDNSVVLLIQPLKTNLTLNVLKLYTPNIFQSKYISNFGKEIISSCQTSNDALNLLQYIDNSLKIEASILDNLNNSKVSRVLIYGPQNSGKSTLARILINGLLEEIEDICYLDCDMGQSEFTPSGCVSLISVNKPLFGPPFTHLKSPLKMCCVADSKVNYFVEKYILSIEHLMKIYHEEHSSKVLFINTMGFITGVGASILHQIREIVKPTIMIELLPTGKRAQDFHLHTNPGKIHHHIIEVENIENIHKNILKGKKMRDLSALAYFSQCINPTIDMDFISIIPYSILMKKIALFFAKRCLNLEHVCESLLNVYVALCVIDGKELDSFDTNKTPPKIFDELPFNECLGFGIVRSICEEMYYVVTPLSLEAVNRCNLFIRCNIDAPDEIYTKRITSIREQPFIFKITQRKVYARKKIKGRAGRFKK